MLQFSFILQFLIWKFANVVGVELDRRSKREEEIEDQVSDPRAAARRSKFFTPQLLSSEPPNASPTAWYSRSGALKYQKTFSYFRFLKKKLSCQLFSSSKLSPLIFPFQVNTFVKWRPLETQYIKSITSTCQVNIAFLTIMHPCLQWRLNVKSFLSKLSCLVTQNHLKYPK